LVHSGATPMGTAAIKTALGAGANVFTTVNSEIERIYVNRHIPQLQDTHIILRTNELSVTNGIEKLTLGKGVNVIFSPSADDSLLEESSFSLSKSGMYVEMGRAKTSKTVETFAASLMKKNKSYSRVDVKTILHDKPCHKKLIDAVVRDMKNGVIQPLSGTFYQAKNISEAFQAAQEPSPINKIIIKIRDEETHTETKPQPVSLPVTPRVTCDPTKSYFICGGLGGLGLEFAHWLVQRGARNIILTSRRGVTTGYQADKIKHIQNNYKANVKVVAKTIKSLDDARQLLQQAQQMGPIGGIFILSLVLNDKYFTQMTKEQFHETANTKINDTMFLDAASRELCGPELEWFVPFSSVAAGWGNASQVNYGFGNSVQERTCDKRKSDGLPGLAIQWGAVGDVGQLMVRTGEESMARTMASKFKEWGMGIQRIDSCLHALDTFLLLKKENVVTTHQPAPWETDETTGAAKTSTLMKATCKIFGMNSMDNVADGVTLGSLGLDSLMGVELKQLLEKDFDVHVTLAEIRKMPMSSLREIDEKFAGQ